MHTQKEVIGGMDFVRQGFLDGTDMSKFAQSFIQPGKYVNFRSIQEMLRLPDNASAADKAGMDRILNIMKNYWITSTFKSPNANQILDDFMRLDPESLKIIFNEKDMLNLTNKVDALKLLSTKSQNLENGIIGKALSQNATAEEFVKGIIKQADSGDFGASKTMDDFIKSLGGVNSSAINDVRNNILKDIFKNSQQISKEGGAKRLQEVLDAEKFADNVKALRENTNLSKFFTDDQFSALKVFEQYARAIGGNLDSGGSIARGAETANIVQNFRLIDAGINILKYDVAAYLLSRPQWSGMLKEIKPGEGLSEFNINLITSAIVGAQTELTDTITQSDKFKDEGVIDVAPAGDQTKNIQPDQPINVTPVNFNANAASRLAQANPVGMVGTPTTDTGTMNPNTMARGQQLFTGPGEITFAAKGGIMNTKKAFQRVA